MDFSEYDPIDVLALCGVAGAFSFFGCWGESTTANTPGVLQNWRASWVPRSLGSMSLSAYSGHRDRSFRFVVTGCAA